MSRSHASYRACLYRSVSAVPRVARCPRLSDDLWTRQNYVRLLRSTSLKAPRVRVVRPAMLPSREHSRPHLSTTGCIEEFANWLTVYPCQPRVSLPPAPHIRSSSDSSDISAQISARYSADTSGSCLPLRVRWCSSPCPCCPIPGFVEICSQLVICTAPC